MKVILLAPTPPPIGGIALWTERMLSAKLNNGWKVKVVDEKIIGNRVVFGDHVRHNLFCEAKRCLKIWGGLAKELRDNDAKIVHACIPANSMPVLRECISALITKVKGRKFVIHFRCTVPNMVNGCFNRIVLKMICRLSNCVMVLNKQSADYISKLSRTRVVIIPNFVEDYEIENSHVINANVKRVVYAGGVIETKGCSNIIELAKSYPDIQFKLIGNSDTHLKKLAREVANVELTGPMGHNEVHNELVNADIFIFLTYFAGEGFSNSLVEAMACGVPCLVSDWAANRDMIGNEGGYVVPIRDVNQAIEAFKRMLSAKVREKQSQYNICKVKREYTSKIVLAKYVDCYESLLKE